MKSIKFPLVILGFDAALPHLLIRWGNEGSLPTLQSLMKNGAWGMIRGPEMLFEHGFWPSLVSGVSRKDHGYFYFRQTVPGSYDLKTYTGRDTGISPFWSRFQGKDTKIATFDIPDIFPVPGVKGVQLSDWTVHNPVFPAATSPTEMIREVKKVFGKRFVIKEIAGSSVEQDRLIYSRLMQNLRRKGKMIRHFLSKDRFDLVTCFFAESHVGTHQFWKYHSHSSEEYRRDPRGELQNAIPNIYRAIDEEIGLILKMLPQEANTVFISSSGMQDQYPCTELIDSFCRELGYQVLRKSEARPKRGIDALRRLIPEKWRIELSKLLLSREQRESLLSDQFKNYTDWGKTRAFASPSLYNSYIRVNLKGREPEGTVAPQDYGRLLDEFERDLMLLTDAESGETIVAKVVHIAETFGTGPHKSLPDLVVQWKPIPRLLRKVRHPKCILTQQKPEFYRGSDHSDEGFYTASGPGIRERGEMKDASVLDFVPAFLDLMGEAEPAREKALFS